MMLNQKTEPEIIYGQAFIIHLQHLYNFRISYPDDEIVLMDDDVKGAFRHCKYHPDTATAFASLFNNCSSYLSGVHSVQLSVQQTLNLLHEPAFI